MKQKRKVKSLITQKKDWGESVLTTLLLILGVILCLGSASLMTMSVGAASASNNGFDYKSTVDDKTEVLYKLQFSKSGSLSTVVSEMFTDKNDDFYISGGLIVNGKNGNKIGNVKSNILGGSDNEVYSNNITIIGGNENKVAESNDNAIILGGDGNTMTGVSSGNPSIMVGGSSNTISKGHDNDGIIGGSNNTIGENVSNSFIIGGTDNEVNASNVIVGGSNVKVNTGNVFVFSTINDVFGLKFEPQTPNAFYINVKNGLGINTQSVGQGITVNGPVRFGEININTPCNGDNIGVIGSWNGCLVGCTKDGQSYENRWTLFDLGDNCQNLCKNNDTYCFNEVSKIKTGASYNSFCTDGVNTGHAEACTPDVLNQIQNVVFETTLIDSTVACPSNPANKCIYKCNSGYHLTGDRTYGIPVEGGSYACYSDCDLSKDLGPEWVNPDGTPIILKHNQIVTGYNTDNTYCAQHNPYQGVDVGTAGESFPEHCGNNGHKAPLVCVNGDMEIANGYNDPRSTNRNAKDARYIHRDCTVNKFTCDTTPGKFDLRRDYITTTLYDNPIVTDTDKDRENMVGTRGIYKLCLDYDVLESPLNEKAPGNETCNVHLGNDKPYVEHYKFVDCKAGYHRSTRPGETDKYICRKSCNVEVINNKQEKTIEVHDNSSIDLYNGVKFDCLDHCKSKTYYCNDGELKAGSMNGSDANPRNELYYFEECQTIGKKCDGYNVPRSIVSVYNNVSYYDTCKGYIPHPGNGRGWTGECQEEPVKYKLIGCVNGYHAVNSTGNDCNDNPGDYCIIDTITGSCDKYYTKPDNSEWAEGSIVFERKLETRNEGENRWKCANDKKEEKCERYCNYGFRLNQNGTGCEEMPEPGNSNPLGCGSEKFTCSDDAGVVTGEYTIPDDSNGYNEANLEKGWKWSCENGKTSVQCLKCHEPWYHESSDGKSCNPNSCTGTMPNNAELYRGNEFITRPEKGDSPWHFSDSPALDPHNACRIKCEEGYHLVGETYCEKNSEGNVSVYFNLNGGNRISIGKTSLYIREGTIIKLPYATRDERHEFERWNREINNQLENKNYYSGDNYTVYSDTIFVAHWEEVIGNNACLGGDEEPDSRENTEKREDPTGQMEWSYDTGLNLPCTWRCETGYIRKGNKCVEKQCGNKNFPSPTTNVITGSSTYTGDDKDGWTYTDNKNPGACQWTCEAGYMKDPNANKCVEKQCKKPEPQGDGVIKGSSTYTGTDNDREWSYTGSSNLKACEWTCKLDYEKSGNGCIRTIKASCGNPEKHFKCEGGGTATNQLTGRDGSTPRGWTWTCQGTPGGSSQNCRECNTDGGYNRSGDACIKEMEIECVAGEWGEYGVTYPLPEDAKQNPSKYIINRILPNFNVEEDINEWTFWQNETPTHYGQTDWEYYGSDMSCAWSCAEGYHINNEYTECVEDDIDVYPTCGQVKMGSGSGRNDKVIDWSLACPGENDYLLPGSKNENGRMYENGCGEQAYTWICRNDDTQLESLCHYKRKMGYFNLYFQKLSYYYPKLGELTIARNFGLGVFAFRIKITDSYNNSTSFVVAMPGDEYTTEYNIKYEGNLPPDERYFDRDTKTYYVGVVNNVKKIEFVKVEDEDSVIGGSKGVDRISFSKDAAGDSNCQAYDNVVYLLD